MEIWKHGDIYISYGNMEKWRHGDMHGDMETWTWKHGDVDNGHGDMDNGHGKKYGHGDMDLETGHGGRDIETWAWRVGHGDMDTRRFFKIHLKVARRANGTLTFVRLLTKKQTKVICVQTD